MKSAKMMIDTMLVHQPSSCSMLRLMLGSLLAVGKSAWLGPSRDGREGKRRSSYRLCCHFLGSGHPPNNDSCTTMAMAAGPPLNTDGSDAPSQSSVLFPRGRQSMLGRSDVIIYCVSWDHPRRILLQHPVP
jgi:hypothetical protein